MTWIEHQVDRLYFTGSAQDGVLLGKLTRIFVETMHRFYAARVARDGAPGAKTGSVTALQRTSSDLRLKPHLHVVVLDGCPLPKLCPASWGLRTAAKVRPESP